MLARPPDLYPGEAGGDTDDGLLHLDREGVDVILWSPNSSFLRPLSFSGGDCPASIGDEAGRAAIWIASSV
jgi:hypothetical protein